MDKVLNLFKQRRLWVVAIPLAVFVGQFFGLEVTEELLTTTLDKVLGGGVSALALWSYLQPKT